MDALVFALMYFSIFLDENFPLEVSFRRLSTEVGVQQNVQLR